MPTIKEKLVSSDTLQTELQSCAVASQKVKPVRLRRDFVKPRDTQRSKVYSWEREWVYDGSKIPLATCQALVNEVCTVYQIKPPCVTDGRARRRACYEPSTNKIKLPKELRLRNVVLHEIAHALTYRWARVTPQNRQLRTPIDGWHGPTFVRIYINLLIKYGVLSVKDRGSLTVADFVSRAKDAGVKVAPAAHLTPPSSRNLNAIMHKRQEIELLQKKLVELKTQLEKLLAT